MKNAGLLFAGFACAITLAGCDMTSSAERLELGKQVLLSAHPVMPKGITRAANGDLVVFGGSDQANSRAWATRLDQTGKAQWEFIEGGQESWNDHSASGQQFYGAVALPDQATLLCGIKIVNNVRLVMLITISKDGAPYTTRYYPRFVKGKSSPG